MLSLTKKTEYGLIALSHLARSDSAVLSARDVADHYGLKVPLMMSVLKMLNQGGLIRSIRGVNGGYALAAPAAEIEIIRVIDAIEGPARLVKCAPAATHESCCDMMSCCPLRHPILKVHAALESFLRQYTIADIAFDDMFGVTSKAQSETALRILENEATHLSRQQCDHAG